MRIIEYYTISIFCIIIGFLTSCSDVEKIAECEVENKFVITRSSDDPASDEVRTYRILTYNYDNYGYDIARYGTYIGCPGEPLSPCVLDSEGNPNYSATKEETSSAVLDRVNGKRRVVCISPGVKHNPDGSVNFTTEKEFLCCDTVYTYLAQWATYQLPLLTDNRSKLEFNVYVNDDFKDKIKEIDIRDFQLSGCGSATDTITYYPAQHQAIVSEKKRIIDFTDDSPEGFKQLQLKNEQEIIVASSFYAPKEDVVRQLNVSNNIYIQDTDYIYATFKLSENGSDKYTNMTICLTKDLIRLLPMHKYVFNFSVKSLFLDLSVDIYSYDTGDGKSKDWINSADDLTSDIGSMINPITINIGTWKIGDEMNNDWISENLEHSEI